MNNESSRGRVYYDFDECKSWTKERLETRVGVELSCTQSCRQFEWILKRIKDANKTLNASVEFETYTQAEL